MSDLVRRTSTAIIFSESREIRALRRRVEYAQAHVDGEAAVCGTRIDDALRLGRLAVNGIAGLDTDITERSHDNPGLELRLRGIEQTITSGVQLAIFNFLNP
jgi:hypothetical protein